MIRLRFESEVVESAIPVGRLADNCGLSVADSPGVRHKGPRVFKFDRSPVAVCSYRLVSSRKGGHSAQS